MVISRGISAALARKLKFKAVKICTKEEAIQGALDYAATEVMANREEQEKRVKVFLLFPWKQSPRKANSGRPLFNKGAKFGNEQFVNNYIPLIVSTGTVGPVITFRVLPDVVGVKSEVRRGVVNRLVPKYTIECFGFVVFGSHLQLSIHLKGTVPFLHNEIKEPLAKKILKKHNCRISGLTNRTT